MRATQDVVVRRARRDGVDVLLLGEPNRRLCVANAWLSDARMDAAIVLLNDDLVVNSTGSPGMEETMKKEKYKNILQQVQRKMALSVSSAYRTVSAEAAQVLAGLIPID